VARITSGAKAQRRKENLRKRGSALRLCAFAREIILATDAPWVFVQSLLSEPESYNLRAIFDAAILLNIDCSDA